jgi:transposase
LRHRVATRGLGRARTAGRGARPGGLERAQLVLADWLDTRRRLADVERRMVAVLDELGLTGLVTSIHGLTAVGAATLLAETGDLIRLDRPPAVVKHAGLSPRVNASGAHQGKTSLSGPGRPELRLAAWRAVWAALPNNSVLATRFHHLTTREDNRLARQWARAACAAAVAARPGHSGVHWNTAIAAGDKQLSPAA